MKNRKIVFLGMMIALALIASYVEAMLPIPQLVAGIKLGLANSIVMMILYVYGAKEAATVNIIRILLSGFLFGNMAAIIYSLAGAVLSFGIMVLLKKTGKFSYVGVSVAGGIAHNVGQLIVAILTVSELLLLYYLPFLLIGGIVAGVAIGVLSGILVRYTKRFLRTEEIR